MEAGNYVMQDQYNRIQGAKLKIQNKIYSVYKGVNIIGRNKSATIDLKNLNVSQYHAMIVILDDSQHFLSDLNSSNGTYLYGNKITPFKLFEISNETEIKFGDVTGLYSKISNTNAIVHLETRNMELTQNFSQTFYAAQTQLMLDDSALNQTVPKKPQQQKTSRIETQDIHEAATQVIEYPPTINTSKIHVNKNSITEEIINNDIHNAATQVIMMPPQQPSTSKSNDENIHEVATQLITLQQRSVAPRQPEENIHEVATQIVTYLPDRPNSNEDEKKETSSMIQNKVVEEKTENVSAFQDSIIEETVVEDSIMEEIPNEATEETIQIQNDENSNDSVDFLAINRPPDIETQMQDKFDPYCNDDKSVDPEDIVKSTKQPVHKLNSSEKLQSQDNTEKCNSDSETDIEETEIIALKKKPLRKLSSSQSDVTPNIHSEQNSGDITQKQIHKAKVINSDSETDVDDTKNNELPMFKKQIKPSQNEVNPQTSNVHSEHDSEDIIRKPTRKAKIISSDSETDIDDTDVPQTDLNKGKLRKKSLRKLNSQGESKTNSLELNGEDIKRKHAKVGIICSDSDTDVEDDKNRNIAVLDNRKGLSRKLSVHSDSETDIEDNKENELVAAAAQNDDSNSTELLNDTDCIPATQDAFANMFDYKSKISSSNRNSENVSSEESFKLGLTELMIDENDQMNKKSEQNSPVNRNVDEVNKDIPETNKIDKQIKRNKELSSKEKNVVEKDEEKNAVVANAVADAEREPEEEFYLMATQKIDNISSKQKECINVVNVPTQKIRPCNKPENILSMATQPIDEENQPDEDFYIMPTQKICDIEVRNREKKDIFSVVSQGINKVKIGPSTKSATLEEDNDEDLYMMPTQVISDAKLLGQHKKVVQGKPSTVTSKMITDHEEGQDEDFYMMATQKINEDGATTKAPQKFTSKIVTDHEKGEDEDFYMMATQKINEDEATFKAPQRFTFKKKVTNLDGSLTTILGNKPEDDPYSVDTQKICEISDSKCNKTGEESNTKIDSNTNEEKVRVISSHDDLYLQPTQELKVDTYSNKKDDPYMAPTQQINPNVNSSEVLKNNGKSVAEENIYVIETQTELHMSASSKDKPYSGSLKTNQNNYLYEIPTQPLLHSVKENTCHQVEPILIENMNQKSQDDKDLTRPRKGVHSSLKRLGDASPDVPKMKRLKKSDLESLRKTIETTKREDVLSHGSSKDDDGVETLSQIETFIKKPSTSRQTVSKRESTAVKNVKENVTMQDSETLSQIEAFVKKPLDKILTANKNKETSSFEKEVKPEKPFVSKPVLKINTSLLSNTDKESVVIHNKTSGSNKEADAKLETAPSRSSTRKTRAKQSKTVENDKEDNISTLKVVDYTKSKTSNKDSDDDNLNAVSDTSSSKLNSEQDSTRSDVDQSFALLEAKSSKTRKSQRITNVGEVKVTVRKNRRSMTTSSIAELPENKKKTPSTRKSRRVLNNNLEPTSTITEVGDSSQLKSKKNIQNKDKSECSDSDFSEPEVPVKMIKISAAKGKANVKVTEKTDSKIAGNKENQEKVLPVTAALKTKINAKTKTTSNANTKSSVSSNPLPATPSRRGTRTKIIDEIENLPAPSTSKTKISSRTKDRSGNSSESSSCDRESVSSNDPILATPSRRGRSTAPSDTTLAMSERSKRKLRPKVVFTMLDSPQLESLIRHLGGSIVDTVDSCTVLVTEHVKRSQKLLTAVGQGKPICSPDWIRASKKANEFLDPWDFILIDKEAESKWNFSLKDAIRRAAADKLLTNYTFQLMVSSASDVLKGSIEACGGKCLKTLPKNVEGFLVVVSSPENRNKYLKIKKQNPEVTVVESEAVFDGVLRQELRLGRHLMT